MYVIETAVNFIQLTKKIDSFGLEDKYKELEKVVLEENRIHHIKTKIKITKKYISPKGQNHYSSSTDYTFFDIDKAIKEKRDYYKANAEYKARVEYERAQMTPRLRYQVMRRDGFRCVLCGAGSNEGAILHIDHIKPVSKGGKTELSNLRTLCDRCNLGKGNLFIDDGIN